MIISCRFHYTIDVLVATFLTLFVWYFYGVAAYVPSNVITKFVLWVQFGGTTSNVQLYSKKNVLEIL